MRGPLESLIAQSQAINRSEKRFPHRFLPKAWRTQSSARRLPSVWTLQREAVVSQVTTNKTFLGRHIWLVFWLPTETTIQMDRVLSVRILEQNHLGHEFRSKV